LFASPGPTSPVTSLPPPPRVPLWGFLGFEGLAAKVEGRVVKLNSSRDPSAKRFFLFDVL
jgi:hypothetical protein